MFGNVFVYDICVFQAPNLSNTNRIENPRGFLQVGLHEQLIYAVLVTGFS